MRRYQLDPPIIEQRFFEVGAVVVPAYQHPPLVVVSLTPMCAFRKRAPPGPSSPRSYRDRRKRFLA